MIERLRRPTAAQLARLSTLHRAAFEPASRGWSADELRSLSDGAALFADPNLTAFALFSLAADEAEVLTIAVDPGFRRRGLAASILRDAQKDLAAAGVTVIHLEVAADNTPAINLYQGLGFTRTGRRSRYYQRPGGRVDALTMARPLSISQRVPPRT